MVPFGEHPVKLARPALWQDLPVDVDLARDDLDGGGARKPVLGDIVREEKLYLLQSGRCHCAAVIFLGLEYLAITEVEGCPDVFHCKGFKNMIKRRMSTQPP